jgi:hypothetical protein
MLRSRAWAASMPAVVEAANGMAKGVALFRAHLSRRAPRQSRRSDSGQFDQFPPTSPSVGCPFRQETFAGAAHNGQDAPKPTLHPPPGSFRSGTVIRSSRDEHRLRTEFL